MKLTKEQRTRLDVLIKVARKNGDKIVAVNRDFDAYCPEQGILFPDYEQEHWHLWDSTEEMVEEHMAEDVVRDAIGEKKDWAKEYSHPDKVYADSFYGSWVDMSGETIGSDEAGEEGGNCREFGISYKHLNLLDDVKPNPDPFEAESKKWQAILGE